MAYEIPEHAEGFPPCAFFLAAGDELVSPEHSRTLARKLEALHIPCRLEIGPEGGHGFADGSGMCMAGWTKRAVDWYESLLEDHPGGCVLHEKQAEVERLLQAGQPQGE